MLDAFVRDGMVTLVALAALAMELLLLVGMAAARRRAPDITFVANLLSGLFLILALRAALLGQGSVSIALYLGLGGMAHLADIAIRLLRSFKQGKSDRASSAATRD